MLSKLRKFSDVLNTAYSLFAVVFLALCIFCIGAQVVTRFIFNSSQAWTEESARYAFIWANIMGATVALKNGSHAAVDILLNYLPPKAKVVQRFFIRLLILYCSVIMVVEGINLLNLTMGQLSAAVRLPMQYVYVAVPLGGLGMLVHTVVDTLVDIDTLRHKKGEEV
jgi:TRAP-type C4-dicarboxylate transport system permease small subunit